MSIEEVQVRAANSGGDPPFRPDTPRVVAGGGLDQPYREMSSSGPDVDQFLPEQ